MIEYVTGKLIRELREKRGITQMHLGEELGVTDKTISKWENQRGLPDITLLEPLAKALQVSVVELLSGEQIKNENVSGNMKKLNFYVCPVCSNIITSVGKAQITCHGINLPPLESEEADEMHNVVIENIEDEIYVNIEHDMDKNHYISFIAMSDYEGITIKKLYPEGEASGRFKKKRGSIIYFYCNRHGLFSKRI